MHLHIFFQNGLDFSTAVFNPSLGSYALPVGTLYPYKIGIVGTAPNVVYNYDVVFDSIDKDKGKNGEWKILAVGLLFLFNSTGTFGGTRAPSVYAPNDVLGYAHYNAVRLGKPWTGIHLEQFLVTSPWPTKQFANSEGLVENSAKILMKDKDGNVGYGVISTSFADPFGDGATQFTGGNIYWK